MRSRHLRPFLLSLGLGLTMVFAGCDLVANDDDDDRVQPPDDDDDDGLTRYSGTVTDWSTEDGIPGLGVRVGDDTDTTNDDGEFSIRSPLASPQQVDFYEDPNSVTSYANCETEIDHRIFSSGASRGGSEEIEITIRLTGYQDMGTLSGEWYREVSTGGFWLESFEDVGPTQAADGSWYLTLTTQPTANWWLSVSELNGGIVTWGAATGTTLSEPEEEVSFALSDQGLSPSRWNGDTDPRVARVRAKQAIMPIGEWRVLYLPVLNSVPTGAESSFLLAEGVTDDVVLDVQRNDLDACDSHGVSFDVLHDPAEVLTVPELFDVFSLVNAREGDWAFRPEVRWQDAPDDPDGFLDAYLYAYGDSIEWTRWRIETSQSCEVDTAVWPTGWEPVAAESFGWISTYYYGDGRSSFCTSFFEFPSL